MAKVKAEEYLRLDPDQRPLGTLQAKRLGALANVDMKEVAGLSVADILAKLRWRIDPELLRFRRICGRVVKKDPTTGAEYPVPNATVHVEDLDCHLLAYSPLNAKWMWFFPFFCTREEIGSVKTDACGNFCVWVPRWEIDWILRFRHERICFPEVFVRPSLWDLIHGVLERPVIVRPRVPEPDPPPFRLRDLGLTLAQLESTVGRDAAVHLAALDAELGFGSNVEPHRRALDRLAFSKALPPPLPAEFQGATFGTSEGGSSDKRERSGTSMQAVRSTIAARLGLKAEALERFDLRQFYGPFRRCIDFVIREWTAIFDVPDITFRVTQDVNGDGVEEEIYGEGFFDVRWDAGPLPDVTLEASPIALATHACRVTPIPCGNVPDITSAGLMPLDQTASPLFYDIATGYNKRTNRPHPSGSMSEALPAALASATAPFCDTVQLYGCVRTNPQAKQYRFQYSYSADGNTFTPFVPLSAGIQSWPLNPVIGGILVPGSQGPDAAGWFKILTPLVAPDHYAVPAEEFLLLEWLTGNFPDGVYLLKLELGAGGVVLTPSPKTWAFRIDNSAPKAPWTIEWRRADQAAWTPIKFPCPVVRRGTTPHDVLFRVRFDVSATHLLSAAIGAGDCGSGGFTEEPSVGSTADLWLLPQLTSHWHQSAADNAVTLATIYRLSPAAPQGTYNFGLDAVSRAFNPAGSDSGHVDDFFYDTRVKWTPVNVAFSVIDAD